MTSALLDSPAVGFRTGGGQAAGGRRPTLAELLSGTLHAARSQAQADCPLCHAEMRYANGAARCESCGTTLS
jgi:hypothetical protein